MRIESKAAMKTNRWINMSFFCSNDINTEQTVSLQTKIYIEVHCIRSFVKIPSKKFMHL